MAEYHLTNQAVLDLNGIWNYTVEKWSQEQADKYYGMLTDLCDKLASDPELGRQYDEIFPGLFGMNAGRHMIFYRRLEPDLIEVIRILHDQMDLENRLSDPRG